MLPAGVLRDAPAGFFCGVVWGYWMLRLRRVVRRFWVRCMACWVVAVGWRCCRLRRYSLQCSMSSARWRLRAARFERRRVTFVMSFWFIRGGF